MNNSKKILLIAHKFLHQPDDDLVIYLKRNNFEVSHITHDFNDHPNRQSHYIEYDSEGAYNIKNSINTPKLFLPVLYVKELYFTLYYVFKSKKKFSYCICMDGLCTFFGLILKFTGRVDKVIYWATDFVPSSRFGGRISNFIYHKINIYGYSHADEMWDLSPRMKQARKDYLGFPIDGYRTHKVVPYGMWLQRVRTITYEECERNTCVFMGHLIEKQGVQLFIKAIPQILKTNPNFKFNIIGKGSYEANLKDLVKTMNLSEAVVFLGKIEENEKLEEEIAKSCIAVAPYIESLDTWTKYADPGKVKTYLACGVPVLLTDVPWNASEIESEKCGLIISEDLYDIVEKVNYLMGSKVNSLYRENAIKYSMRFDYESIFKELCL